MQDQLYKWLLTITAKFNKKKEHVGWNMPDTIYVAQPNYLHQDQVEINSDLDGFRRYGTEDKVVTVTSYVKSKKYIITYPIKITEVADGNSEKETSEKVSGKRTTR